MDRDRNLHIKGELIRAQIALLPGRARPELTLDEARQLMAVAHAAVTNVLEALNSR